MKRGQSRAAQKTRKTGIAAAAEAFQGFRPASEVLRVVRAVPTRFVQLDWATKVGGLPIDRFMLLHGPSGEGKTYFSLGLLDSFLARDHLALLIDAERTTPITWARSIMQHADSPGFFAIRPSTYEDTVEQVRDFTMTLKKQRDEGVVDENTSALIVVDSIRKLVPKNIMAKIAKDTEKHGIDGMGGRAGQIKAAMNAAWMDELVPLLDDTGTAMLVISRETVDGEADKWSKMAGTDFKVQGGSSLYYDSSLVFRVDRAAWVSEKTGEGSETKNNIFGERHRITVRKTKVAGQEDKVTRAYFHTSNGKFTPSGFDRARDVLDLAVKFGVVEKNGSWFSHEGERLGQGEHNAVKNISNNEEWLTAIEIKVREAFARIEPEEFDADSGEIFK